MTALQQYQKLECSGLWRDMPEAQRRDVVVSFGEASLTLTDPRSGLALAHWSLPAVDRLNPGVLPALYAPGADAPESLELQDTDMIAALDKVRTTLIARRPRQGRLREAIVAAATATLVGMAVLWLPGAMVKQSAQIAPQSTRVAIGRMALADLTRVTGQTCHNGGGQAALDKLATRVFGTPTPQLFIVSDATQPSILLPGQIIVLNRALIEMPEGPETAAGAALAAAATGSVQDPLIPLLQHSGLWATFGLLTRGSLDAESVAGYGEVLMRHAPVRVPDDVLLERFLAADIPVAPYASTLDTTQTPTPQLTAADADGTALQKPILADGDWITLQAICAE